VSYPYTTRGLESVVAADTQICFVDGKNGRLYFRGYSIDELAGNVSFEEVVYLLWYGDLPAKEPLEELRARLISEMRLPGQVHDLLRVMPPSANPMVVLRTAVSAMGVFDPDGGVNTDSANMRKAIRILAQVATIVATLHRIHSGQPILSPDARKGFAENFLYMLHGTMPDEVARRAFDALLVVLADHGLTASTFAARVTVSTLAGMHSAISAALACLKGPLHGGANVRVLEMLEDLDDVEELTTYIEGMRAQQRHISGFGHRVYQTEDPRSALLRDHAEKVHEKAGLTQQFQLANRVEQKVLRLTQMRPNVDFYSAITERALGIPKAFFTSIFAVARTAGWTAHVIEQFRCNRLIRPTSNYTGGYDKKFVPIEQRSKSAPTH